MRLKPLEACGAAFLELAWLMRSQGKSDREIYLAMTILRAELEERKIREIPLTLGQLLRAHSILAQQQMTFFDALIIANVEDSRDKTVLSNDQVFEAIKTVKRLPLR